MKKVGAVLCVLVVAILCSACRTFNNDETVELPVDDPTAVVFVQLNAGVVFDPSLLPDLKAAILTQSEQIKATNPDAPYVTDAQFSDTTTDEPFALTLTITNSPAQVVTLATRPWTITRTYTIFNPLSLLPADARFTYYTGLTTDRRHSSANTNNITPQTDGNYAYLWTGTDALVLTDVFPNRTLYYLCALGAAAAVGVVVFLVARYISCKKSRQPL